MEKRYEVYMNSDAMRREERSKEKLYVHHVYQQIETIVPRMVTPDPKFDLDPREGQDEMQVRALQRKIDYDLEVDGFVNKQVDFAKTALICGVTVGKVIWDRRVSNVKVHDYSVKPMDLLGGAPATKVVERVDRNGPSCIPVNLWDFFPYPGCATIDEMPEVFHRVWLSDDEVRARMELVGEDGKPVYKNLNKVLAGSGMTDESRQLPNESPEDATARRGEDRHEFIERWRNGRLTVIADRQHLVRDCHNPYWHGRKPFVGASTQPDIRSFVGISEVEVIENIARMIHKFENLRLRAAEFAVNPVLKIARGLKGSKKLEWRPGAHLYLDRPDQIQAETAPANLGAAWDEVQAYLGYMQQVSGVSPFIAGADPGASGVNQETATGASILQAEANKRLALKLLQMQIMYSQVAKMFVQLNQQFMTKPELVRVAGAEGNEWVQVDPKDIAGAYDVRASNSTESLAKNAEVERISRAIETLMPMHGVPLADGTVVDIKYPLKSLLDAIGVDANQCFAQAPPPPPMMGDMGGQPPA